MKKLLTISMVVALAVMLAVLASPPSVRADDDDHDDKGSKRSKADFALFDGTNPDNVANATPPQTTTGVVCGASHKGGDALKPNKEFTYYFSVTNFDGVDHECKVIYTDGDFVRYKIPVGTSLNINQAGGSGVFDAGV